MKRHTLWGACIIAAMAVALSASVALAAPALQDAPPTPTVPPPPPSGGRVVVPVLNVRSGPSVGWPRFRALLYGDSVFPVGRNRSGEWIAVDIGGTVGWVWHEGVMWDPALDLTALPVIEKPSIPPPSATPLPLPLPSLTPLASTPTRAAPSPTVVNTSPTPTRESAPTATPTLTPSPTTTPPPQVAALPPQSSPAPEAVIPPSLSSQGPPLTKAWHWLALGGLLALAGIIYGWRWGRGQREIKRYADGFPLEVCPTCQSGRLHLEEYIQRPLGIAVLRRSVHCDTCRSILRQIRPGWWRYTIDPLVNPALAEEYNGHSFADTDLLLFAEQARAYEPAIRLESPAASEDFERAVEHLTALEQQVLAAEAEERSAESEAADNAGDADAEEEATD